MGSYKFEGTVKSTLTATGVEFAIEPTSKYTLKVSSGGKEVKAYVAFDYDTGRSKVIRKNRLRIVSKKLSNRVYMWLNTHSDTDKPVTFMVDNHGRLVCPLIAT